MRDRSYRYDRQGYQTAIKLILDNHSAHKSKETMAWLAQQSKGRFTLVYTPKHGSWLNLVEGSPDLTRVSRKWPFPLLDTDPYIFESNHKSGDS